MKKIILLVLAIPLFAVYTSAQSKKESIKVLFGLMQQDTIVKKTFEAMTSSAISGMAGDMNDSSYQKIMAKSMETGRNIAMKLVNEDLVDIYDKYFTQEEINDFIRFYKSKSGQKMVTKIPDIHKEIMTVMTAKYTQEFLKGMND